MSTRHQDAPQPPATLAGAGEDGLLRVILPRFAGTVPVLLGPGDDAALLATPHGHVIATTDTMVRGIDWRDDWSSPQDVGHKIVVSNVADIAAMGGRPTGLLIALMAGTDTTLAFVEGLADGIAAAAARIGAGVLGGDLSGAAPGTVAVAVTALGELPGPGPVRRDGARLGDHVAVCGTLGHAAAGLALLRGEAEPVVGMDTRASLIGAQRRPHCPLDQGPAAAAAGVHAMIDISDGLLRDAARIARASDVHIDLSSAALAPDVAVLAAVLGEEAAWRCVLGGGEEHSLLACYPAEAGIPAGWRRIGHVVATGGGLVTLDGQPHDTAGWDHFEG